MKRQINLIAVIFFTCAALNGCAPDDTSVQTTGTSGGAPPAEITTSMEAAQAASSVAQAREFLFAGGDILGALGRMGLGALDPALPDIDTDLSCADYGTYKYTGTYDGATSSYDLTFTFSLCRENGFQYDGTYKLTGASAEPTIRLGESSNQFSILNFGNDYSVLISYMKTTQVFIISGAGTTTDANYTITTNGSLTAFDYLSLSKCAMQFNQFKINYMLSTDVSSGNQTTSIIANGIFAESWGATYVKITFTNFTANMLKLYDTGTSSFYADEKIVNGTMAIDFRPNAFCFEGTLNVITETAIRSDYSADQTTQGTVVLNEDATVQYNPGGDITVTANGDAPLTYTKEYILRKLCNFFAMEQETPPIVGQYGSATGSTMTITAVSMGTSLQCYTDVHVNYYTISNPVSTSTITWYIDWHTGLGCTAPEGIPYEEAKDITDDNTCDVGLDINGAAQDYTSGGVEHFTATILPVGYYVVSINNYSCATDTTNIATIQIGDYLFGTYICAYTAYDVEGTDPNAWCRLADVRVNSDGAVDVITPNYSLNPWHD